MEKQITALYEKYNPEKLPDLPGLLAKYRAGEGLDTLLERVKIKYDVLSSDEDDDEEDEVEAKI